MNQTLRWAIVGCGVIAEQHAKAIAQVEGCQCVAVLDTKAEISRAFAEKNGISKYYSDFEQMMAESKIDVVSVCTPSGLHEKICLQAASHGCHLLVEKPIEISLAATDRIISACNKNGVKLGVVFQRRMAVIPQKTHQAIKDGLLGDLIMGDLHLKYYRPQSYYDGGGWRGTWALDGGGVLIQQGAHTVDQLQWMMGPVKSVYAHFGTLAHQCEAEDVVVAVLKFANGALGTLEATTACYPAYGHRLEFHGKKGSIMIMGDMRVGDRIAHAGFLDAKTAFNADELNALKPDPADGFPGGHVLHVKDLQEAIYENRDPAVTAAEARKSLQIICAIYQSAKTGQEVVLDSR